MLPKNTGWVSGKLPAKLPQPQSPVSGGPQALKRIERMKQRQTIGVPLVEALRQRSASPAISDARRYLIGGVLATGIGLGVTGVISGNAPWLFAGASMGLIAVAIYSVSRSNATDLLPDKLAVDAEELDRVLESYAALLPTEAITLLVKIKEALVRALMGTLPLDDALFAKQMIARYIPDACRHYCNLKAVARSSVQISTDRTAEDSLLDQLQIMDDRLTRILDAIIADKADQLAHHEKFLQMKR
jgi:hypothetical protein